MFPRTVALLLLAAAVTGAPEGRITGGTPARLGEIPFQLSLQNMETGQHFCGGVIVDSFTAITVASCVDGLDWGEGQVVAGTIDIGLTPSSVHEIKELYMHPDYVNVNNVARNDIAVIKVDPPFPANSVTGRAIMPPTGFPTPMGVNLTISGWGTTSLGGTLSSLLLKAEVPQVDWLSCATTYLDLGISMPDNQICAGLPEGGVDACERDNGGPLFRNGVVYGLFSWGGGCGFPGLPGVYTEVSAYRNWVESIPNP